MEGNTEVIGGNATPDLFDLAQDDDTTLEVADWVILLGLPPRALGLYVYMCHLARYEDGTGKHVSLSTEDADQYAEGKGETCLNTLIEVGAITKGATQPNGKRPFTIHLYPPYVQKLLSSDSPAAAS